MVGLQNQGKQLRKRLEIGVQLKGRNSPAVRKVPQLSSAVMSFL